MDRMIRFPAAALVVVVLALFSGAALGCNKYWPAYHGRRGCVLGEYCSFLGAWVDDITVAKIYENHFEFLAFHVGGGSRHWNWNNKVCTDRKAVGLATFNELNHPVFKTLIGGAQGAFTRGRQADINAHKCVTYWDRTYSSNGRHCAIDGHDTALCGHWWSDRPSWVTCSRAYASPVTWTAKDGYETVYVRQAVSLAGALKICSVLKAQLGTDSDPNRGYNYGRYTRKRMWTGMVFDQPGDPDTRTSPRWISGQTRGDFNFHYESDPGAGTTNNYMMYDRHHQRFHFELNPPWAPLICTRALKPYVMHFNDKEQMHLPCYLTRVCVIRISLADGDVVTLANTNGKSEPLRLYLIIQGTFRWGWRMIHFPQNQKWGNERAEYTFQEGNTGISTHTGYITPTCGYKDTAVLWPSSTFHPLNQVTFDTASPAPELWYVGASWNGRMYRNGVVVLDPGTITVCCEQFTIAFTSEWGGDENRYRTFTATANVVGDFSFNFALSSGFFKPRTADVVVKVLPKISLGLSLGSLTFVVVGETVSFEAKGPAGSKVVEATTFVPSFDCPGATISPGTVTFAKGTTDPTATFSLTPGAQDNAKNCKLSITADPPVHQFKASEILVLVRPKLSLFVTGLPAKVTKGVSYTYTIGTSGFYSGTVAVSAQCGDAVLGAAVTLSPSSLTGAMTFAVPGGSALTFCDLTLATSGASAAHFDTFAGRRVEYSDKTELSAEVNTTTPYVGEAVLLKLSEPSQLTAGQTAVAVWTITAGAGAATLAGGVTTGSLSLAFGQPTATVVLVTATTGTLTITFSITTAPVTFRHSVASLSATVQPLLAPTVPTLLSGRITVGASYARTVSVALPQLPWRWTVTVTAHFTAADVDVSPTTKTWAATDGANDAAVFTITAKVPVNGTAVWFNVSGTATDYDTSGQTAVYAGALDAYERATLGLEVVGKNATYAVQGNTLTFRATASHPLPHALLLSLAIPSAVIAAPMASVVIAAWTNATEFVLRPVPGIPTQTFAVTAVVADAATSNATAEIHALTVPLTARGEIWARHTVSVSCNQSALFFGPGNVLTCTLTATGVPGASEGSVTLSGSDSTGAGVTITPQAAVLDTSGTQLFEIAPDPAVDTIRVADSSSQTVTIAVADTSLQFDTQPATITYTASLLRRTTVTLNASIVVFVGVPVPVKVNLPGGRTSAVVVTPAATTLLSFSPPSFTVPPNETAATVSFDVTPARAGDAESSFTVVGEATASPTSDAFTLTASPRLVLRFEPSYPPVTGAGPYVLGQNITVTATLSATVPTGTDLGAALSLECVDTMGGANTPGSGAVLSTASLSFTGDTASVTLSALFTALPCRTAGASSTQVRLAAALSGTAQVYSDPATSTAFDVAPPVSASVTTPAAGIYGGSDRSATFLRLTVTAPPIGDSILSATLTAVPPGILEVAEAGTATALTAPLTATFASSILDEEHTAEWRLTAVAVTMPTTVTVTCVLAGTAATQYALVPASVTFTVRPRLPVSVSGLTIAPSVNSAPALGGHRGAENLLGVLTVALSQPPLPTGNASTHGDFADALVVEPYMAHAPPGAAVFDPPRVEFTPTSATSETISVYAARTTEANADNREAGSEPRILFRTAGAAAQFVPLAAALPEYLVRFSPRSRVLVPQVARVLSAGAAETFQLTLDAAATAAVSVTLSVVDAAPGAAPADATALTLSVSTVQWAVGETGAREVTMTAGDVTSTAVLELRLSVAGPLDTDPVPSRPSAPVTVISTRTVALTLPPFIYANGEAAFGSVRVSGPPAYGLQLEATPTVTGPSEPVPIVPSVVKFDSNSPVQRQISVTAGRTTIPAGNYDTIAATVLLNTFGTAAGKYDAPPAIPLAIRPRERIVVRGLPRLIYVGQSARITVRLSRPPECGGTPVTTVTPRFPTPDAVFSPASASWKLGANVTDYVVFTLTAMSASASVVPVFFDLSGDCLQHYTAVTDVDNTDGTTVLPPEPVALAFESSIVALVDGKSVASAYRNTTLTATVTVGATASGSTPASGAPPHEGVSVLVEYLGREGSVELQDGGLVVFSAGVTTMSLELNATLVSDTAALRLNVVGGPAAGRFASPAASAWPLLRVVRRIAATLVFDPTTTLLVATRTKSIPVTVAQAPPIAMPLTVALSYGGLPTAPEPLLFPAASPKTTLSFVVTPPSPAPAQPMQLLLSGAGAQAFETVPAAGVLVPVLPVQSVRLNLAEAYLFVGASNARTVEFSLSQSPTLSGADVTLTFSASPLITFSEALVKLSAASPTAKVTLTGVAPGTVDLPQFIAVSDTQSEFNGRPLVVGGAASDKVTVRALHTATLVDYGGLMYTNGTAALTLRIPAAPSTGTVSLRPVLGNPAYPLTLVPPTVEFSAGATVLEKTITLRAPATATLPTTQLRVQATGTSEFSKIAATTSLAVLSNMEVGVFGFPATLFAGAANKAEFTVTFPQLPTGEHFFVFEPRSTTGAVVLSPASVTLIHNSTEYLVNGIPTVKFSVQTADAGLTSAGSDNVEFAVTASDPGTTFNTLAVAPVQLFPLRGVTHELQGIATQSASSSAASASVLYVSSKATAVLQFADASIEGLSVTLQVLKRAGGASQRLDDVPASEVFVAAYTAVPSAGRVSFEITALKAGLSVTLRYGLTGPAATTVNTTQIPEPQVFFSPREAITYSVPEAMYVGLESTITITLGSAPLAGTVSISPNIAAELGVGTAPSRLWSSDPTDVSAASSLVWTITVRPTTAGVWAVNAIPILTDTEAYDRTGGSFSVVVRPPTVVNILGVQPRSFVAPNRQVVEVVLSTPLDSGESILVTLHSTAASGISLNPSAEVTLASSGSGRQKYIVEASAPVTARFYATFRSDTNRFVLGASANETTGPQCEFRPLKVPTVTPPPTLDFVVGQRASIQVSVAELPSPGHTLVASLRYFGSPANVQLPPAVQWTSSDAVKTRTLEVLGVSATERETLRVIFSKDTEYKLTYNDAELATVQMELIFRPKFNVLVSLPSSLFMKRDTPFTVSLSSAADLTLRATTSPAGIIRLTPEEIVFRNGALETSVTAHALTTYADGPITLSFAMIGGETIKFNPVPAAATTIIDSTTLLVKVPAPQMVLYVVAGYSVAIQLQLGLDPTGPLAVRPTFDCPGGKTPFRTEPIFSNFSAGDLIQQAAIHHNGVVQSEPCTMQFGLLGFVGIFKPPSQLFTVTARLPHNISLVDVPTRIFVGDANAAALKVALDTDSPLPLTEAITVTFTTTERCLSLSPSSVSWAVGNSAEPFVKSISVTASCIGNPLSVSLQVETKSRKFFVNTPAAVQFDVRNPMKVAITSDAFSGTSNVYYYMFLGSIPLQLRATLPEPLEAGETLTVRMQYDGFEGSTSLPEGTFVGGGAGGLSRSLIVQAFSVAPVEELRFVVTGPPRFDPFASGGGLLEVFGPLYVTAEFPTTLYEGQSQTNFILAQELPFGAETLVATPKWHGAPESLQFAPPNATWLPTSLDLKQPVTLKALEPSEGYTLEVPVSGSTRYTPSAFNSIVQILPQYVVTLLALPRQLTVGHTYGLTINVERQPEQVGGYLDVRLIPQAYNSRRCIEIVPDRITFRADATAGDGVQQRVSVTARTACPSRSIRVAVTGKSATVRRYKRDVVPHIFETVDPQPVALFWPVEAYAGAANAQEVLAQLLWSNGDPAPGAWLNVTITATPQGIVNPNSTSAVSWAAGARPEIVLSVFALENASGTVQFDFAVASSDAAVNNTALPPVTMTFLPKLNLTRGELPPDMYSGVGNRLKVAMNLSAPLGRPQNTAPLEITVRPRASSPLVSFVPAILRWTSGGRALRPLFIEGAAEAANVSLWFDVAGTGAQVLSGVPAPAVISVLAKLNVTFTSPPSELYVGAANSATVELTAPEGVALTVRAVVDGEPTAIVTTPATLRWEADSPRTQPLNIRGVYATPLQCRIRYEIVEGPPFVGMAVLADVSKSLIKLLALRKVTRVPVDYHIKEPELSQQRLVFTPAVHVLCTSSDPAIVATKNAPNTTDGDSSSSSAPGSTAGATPAPGSSGSGSSSNSSADSSSGPSGPVVIPRGTVDLDLVAAGTVEITCVAVDTTFEAPPSFLVTSTPKKKIEITHDFTTFTNTTRTTNVRLSARPGTTTLIVTPVVVGVASSYVRVETPRLLFTTGNDLRQTVALTGIRPTPEGAPVQVRLDFDGPVGEFRPPVPSYFSVTVRPLVTATVAPSARTVFKHSTLAVQRTTGVHEVYIGQSNGFVADITISGPTLTGPLYLTPTLLTGFQGVDVIPVPGSHVQFPVGTTQLTAQVNLARSQPSPTGVVTTLVLRPFNPPDEYNGKLVDIVVGRIRFVPLETLTIRNAVGFPGTIFTGFANRQPLSIEISDYPGSAEVVSVALDVPAQLRASPSVIDFNRPTEARAEPLVKTVYIQGLYANPDPATVTLSWRALPSSSPAFVTVPVVSTVTAKVSTLFRFDVLHKAVSTSKVSFFTAKANAVYLTVAVSGLPLDPFTTFKVNMTVDNATSVVVSPSEVIFARSRNNAALEATVEVYGVAPSFGSQSLRFAGFGPAEFVQRQTRFVTLDVLELRRFEIEGMPATIPIGIDNKRRVRMRPREPSFVTLSVYTDCSQMAFSSTGSSTWVGTMEWQTYEVAATSTTPASQPCSLYADIVGGADGPTYVPKQVSHQVHSVARPRVTFKGIGGVPLLEPAEIAQGSRRFTLQLSGAYRFADAQLFDGTRQPNATIALWSSYSAGEQASGVQAALNRHAAGFFREWSFDTARSELTARIGPVPGFATTSKETVTIELRRMAVYGSVALDAKASSVQFQVNGKPATTVDSGAKSVISNGASAAVVAGGILSLGAATQAGKLQTIMDAFYCPNPDWKLDQDEMDWTEAPIPIRFGATDDLGVYAAVGFGNSLIIFGFLMIHLCIVCLIYKVRQCGPYTDKSFSVAMALARFPSISLFPVLFFVQAIVSAGVRTVMYSPTPMFRVVASVSLLLFGLGLPVAMYLRTGPGFSAVWVAAKDEEKEKEKAKESQADADTFALDEPKEKKKIVVDGSGVKKAFDIVFGECGHWEHPTDFYWCMRNGAFFDEFRDGYRWWQVLDVLIVVVIGVVEGVVPKTHPACIVRNVINIFLFFLQFAITVAFRPYRSLFGNLFFIAANFLQFLSMLLVGIAFFLKDPNSTAFTFSTQVLLLFSFLLLVKAAIDAVFAFRDLSGIDKMLEQSKAARFAKVTEEEEAKQVEEVTRQMSQRLKEDTAKAAQRYNTAVPLREGEQQAAAAHDGAPAPRTVIRPQDIVSDDELHRLRYGRAAKYMPKSRGSRTAAQPQQPIAGHLTSTERRARAYQGATRFVVRDDPFVELDDDL